MNIKTITRLVHADEVMPHTVHERLHRIQPNNGAFIAKTMKTIVTRAYVATYSARGPMCSSCYAVLMDTKVTWRYDNPSGRRIKVTHLVKFKNEHKAMMHGKHKPSCAFMQAVSILFDLGQLQ